MILEMFSNIPFLFGLIAAMIHVVSGPDHIAAVGPLAVSTKFRPWLIGMSWGIGHLIGMLLIGVLFYYFKELIPVDWISTNSERLVGVMLIAIGFWGIFKMIKSRRENKHQHFHSHHDTSGNAFVHTHNHNHSTVKVHTHSHATSEKQTYTTALGIGILHGLAGVSHFITLLPTLAFSNNFDSAMYLAGFGIGTISAMVLFSVLLGLIAKSSLNSNNKYVFHGINGLVGLSAIFVGFIWIWNTW